MQRNYSSRKHILRFIFILTGIIFIIRLFFLQIIENEYKLFAENNVLRYVTQYPARGLIYDRNGELLVFNEAAYDLMVIPIQAKNIDTLELCKLLHIDKDIFVRHMNRARSYSRIKPSVFLEQISLKDYGFLEEQLYKYPGFFVQVRTLRKYSMPIAAHALGYVGEVSQYELHKDAYYSPGDYIGKSGIEKYYETSLRGKKGLKVVMVDVFNREKGSFQNGKYDSAAIAGKDLYISIDASLQQYGERLMQNKKGSIVAIEPASGEILCLISNPAYDPNLLIGRVRSANFARLSQDSLKPLFNRATMAQYSPGSTFKTINAIIALSKGVLRRETKYDCQGVTATPLVCSHNHASPLNLIHAIEQSCNPYFYKVYKSLIESNDYPNIQNAYQDWYDGVQLFGVGKKLDSDLGGQSKGNLPGYAYFDSYYGEKGWKAVTIRSLSIGEGEIQITPLQLANQAAIIANRGFYYPPHILKNIANKDSIQDIFKNQIATNIPESYFETVIEGMSMVYESSNSVVKYYKHDSISMCGKTGTSQNPFGKDHSIFIAFAPKKNPKIAIAVIVENSGFGATWAAPVASLMMEKYITGTVKPKWFEDKMLNANLLVKP